MGKSIIRTKALIETNKTGINVTATTSGDTEARLKENSRKE